MTEAPSQLLTAFVDRVAAVPAVVLAAVVAMFVLQQFVTRLGLWAYALFAFPGTLAHELSHWLVAWLLRADPQTPNLIPQRTPTGWRLGSVAFRAPWWKAGPIALAPLLLAPAALAWLLMFASPARDGMPVVHAWITATLLRAGMPSRADLRIAMRFLLFVVAPVCVALGIFVWRQTGLA